MRALLLTLALAGPSGVGVAEMSAQDFLDRGTFVIVQNGVEIAREEFAIRPTVDRRGMNGVLSVSTVRFRDREVQNALELSAEQAPLSFQETSTQGGRVVARYSAQLSGGRFSARITSHEGESAREFPVRLPVVVLGNDAYHEFYFVPRPVTGSTRTISVVRPSDTHAVAATVETQGTDTIPVGDRAIPANRYVLRFGDGDERRFWMTPNGDLLRVAAPRQGIVATRTEPPPHL
jgi:hypothetical protein